MFKNIKNLSYLDKGKRSIILTGNLNHKKIAIKIEKKGIEAKNRIKNEAKFLKILNKYKIGPKLISSSKKYIIYEYVQGIRILDYFEKSNKKSILKIIKAVLNQCFILDSLKINKEEMHNPYKHILIKSSPVMIDFERAYYTKKPKNLTQFCQFITIQKVALILKKKKIRFNKNLFIPLLQNYKNNISKENFNKIINIIK